MSPVSPLAPFVQQDPFSTGAGGPLSTGCDNSASRPAYGAAAAARRRWVALPLELRKPCRFNRALHGREPSAGCGLTPTRSTAESGSSASPPARGSAAGRRPRAGERGWRSRGVARHVSAGAIDDGHLPVTVDDRPHIGRIAAGDGGDVGVAESGSREDRLGARLGPRPVLLAFADDKREERSEHGLELEGTETGLLVAHLRPPCGLRAG